MTDIYRYPKQILDKSTDYFRLDIVEYTASGIREGKETTTPERFNKDDKGNIQKPDKNKISNLVINRASFSASRSGSRRNIESDIKKKKVSTSIHLPIPSNIQDGNSVNFGPGSMDGFTANALNYARGLMDVDQYNTAADFLTKGVLSGGLALFDNDAREFFMRDLASQAANIPFGGNLTAAQLLARETGQVLNPNMELLFEGVNLRSFRFSFKLTPRSPIEAKEVKQIIRTLKQSMCPSINGKYFLKTPKIFEILYMQGGQPHPFLHKFKQCALTDMSVNYTGEGTYATYGGAEGIERGVPVSMIMDLSFKELEPIYESDYTDNEQGKIGVGY